MFGGSGLTEPSDKAQSQTQNKSPAAPLQNSWESMAKSDFIPKPSRHKPTRSPQPFCRIRSDSATEALSTQPNPITEAKATSVKARLGRGTPCGSHVVHGDCRGSTVPNIYEIFCLMSGQRKDEKNSTALKRPSDSLGQASSTQHGARQIVVWLLFEGASRNLPHRCCGQREIP